MLGTVFFAVDGPVWLKYIVVENNFKILPNGQKNLFGVDAGFNDKNNNLVSAGQGLFAPQIVTK